MDIEVYCDESRQENFAKAGQPVKDYAFIGSLWIEADRRDEYNTIIKELRNEHGYYHEFKWTKIAPSDVDFYIDLIHLFFATDMRFRCIVLPVKDLNIKFHEHDTELMFYKFYYQLLHQWILNGNSYRFYLDLKTSRAKNRLRILRKVLANSNLLSKVEMVQALPSNQVSLIQLSDVLTGAVGCAYYRTKRHTAKSAVKKKIESYLRQPIKPTARSFQKFNIFLFRPGGNW